MCVTNIGWYLSCALTYPLPILSLALTPTPALPLLFFFYLPFLRPNNHSLSLSFSPLLLPEERVAPLEVSRSKLSRHLQGLVFRCHKCTFTCSSDQALQLHLQKHAEIKPYQCQLCYYDSSRRSQLEEHLRLEHKVSWSPDMIHMLFSVYRFKLIYPYWFLGYNLKYRRNIAITTYTVCRFKLFS